MPSEQVEDILGAPTTVEQTTCGQDAGEPWQCRIWEYGTYDQNFMWGTPILKIYFSCETYTRAGMARALFNQGSLSQEELAVIEEQQDSEELAEYCVVNNWNLVE